MEINQTELHDKLIRLVRQVIHVSLIIVFPYSQPFRAVHPSFRAYSALRQSPTVAIFYRYRHCPCFKV